MTLRALATTLLRTRRAALIVVCAMLAVLLSAGLSSASTLPRLAAPTAATGPNSPIGFRMFPASNPWNADVSTLPVDPRSDAYLASIGIDTEVHADFGTVWNGAPNGIPNVTVRSSQKRYPATFYYADESDPGPYPIPPNAPVEGGPNGTGDRHVLTLDVDSHKLYELYDARFNARRGRWEAGSGAIWDLNANCVRPDGWTSADAAGLPMLPGLVRYGEVRSGEITHALRFTVPDTAPSYRFPATHQASDSGGTSLPPMGMRVRLKADYDISGFPADVQVILRALKKYGMIVADNGGPWYISGAPDPRWNDTALHAISQVRGSDFEVVDTSSLEPDAPLIFAGRPVSVRVGATFVRWACFADPKGSSWTARASFGDGRTGTFAVTGDKRIRVAHRFTRPGTYRVAIRVTNDRGRTGTTKLTVTVTR